MYFSVLLMPLAAAAAAADVLHAIVCVWIVAEILFSIQVYRHKHTVCASLCWIAEIYFFFARSLTHPIACFTSLASLIGYFGKIWCLCMCVCLLLLFFFVSVSAVCIRPRFPSARAKFFNSHSTLKTPKKMRMRLYCIDFWCAMIECI